MTALWARSGDEVTLKNGEKVRVPTTKRVYRLFVSHRNQSDTLKCLADLKPDPQCVDDVESTLTELKSEVKGTVEFGHVIDRIILETTITKHRRKGDHWKAALDVVQAFEHVYQVRFGCAGWKELFTEDKFAKTVAEKGEIDLDDLRY